jgi:hypothetical protein
MDKDYRLEVLSFLKKSYPNKVNVSSLVQKYLTETENSRTSYGLMLTTLQKDNFILITPQDLDKLYTSNGGVYNDSSILVIITHLGIDELTRVLKQNYDLSIAERVYKTYFSTRAMAIIATMVSIVLLLLKLAEVLGLIHQPTK